jgi:polygalacturonase
LRRSRSFGGKPRLFVICTICLGARPGGVSRRWWVLASGASLVLPIGQALADPTLPTFGSADYNITVANANIDSGAVAVGDGVTNNATVINAFIKYASQNGGGTVEIPSGTFLSGQINLMSGVDLELDSGAILRDSSASGALIRTSGNLTNVGITGSGAIDGAATTAASGTNLVQITHTTNLLVSGVTIENASHEHLVTENDTNLTINGITIADPGTLAANSGQYLGQTDGIDYSGSNILIENSNISDGDDDIVAKSADPVSNVVIQNDTIGAGHGVSVGGGTAGGLSNMLVNNITFNGTSNGIRIKAQDASGGDAGGGSTKPLTGVTYENITMKNVQNPLIIESFYNGGDIFPSSPTNMTYYPTAPTAQDSFTPDYDNITFSNITATGASNGGLIEGLNTSPASINGLTFNDVNITASSQMNLWYAANVNYSGLTVNVPSNNAYRNATPVNGVWMYDVTVPEPTTLMVLVGGVGAISLRRARRDYTR